MLIAHRTAIPFIMRTTRSITRAIANGTDSPSTGEKRKSEVEPASKSSQKRSRVSKAATSPQGTSSIVPQAPVAVSSVAPALVPAVLTFSFEEAKRHLIGVDHRFQDLFSKMACKPFQHLERVHPFRALVSSILGQQISWMAARSINHKFIRLYDPSIPEKPADYEEHKSPTSFFPTPDQVAATDIATLKTAGLSTRKAEYVQDLAARFADGRLSTEKLVQATDDELAQMLIEVRGIGRWTVDMFAIFSLRRPDILPVGDLGVQRGLVRWFLSLHSPVHNYSLSPEKVGGQPSPKKEKAKAVALPAVKDELPTFGTQVEASTVTTEALDQAKTTALVSEISSVPPATELEDEESDGEEIASMPPAFTPSIKNTLNKPAVDPGSTPVPLPDGLTVAVLKSRLDGKKKIKGAFLTPGEMEDLTECWKPYRSIGVYYMWSLAAVSE